MSQYLLFDGFVIFVIFIYKKKPELWIIEINFDEEKLCIFSNIFDSIIYAILIVKNFSKFDYFEIKHLGFAVCSKLNNFDVQYVNGTFPSGFSLHLANTKANYNTITLIVCSVKYNYVNFRTAELLSILSSTYTTFTKFNFSLLQIIFYSF